MQMSEEERRGELKEQGMTTKERTSVKQNLTVELREISGVYNPLPLFHPQSRIISLIQKRLLYLRIICSSCLETVCVCVHLWPVLYVRACVYVLRMISPDKMLNFKNLACKIIIIIIDDFCIALFCGVPKLTALYNILQDFLSFTNIIHIIMTTNNV